MRCLLNLQWGRWRWLFGGAIATVFSVSWVEYRARQPEFSFLAGKRPYLAEREVPDNFHPGRSANPYLETVYGFKADPNSIIRQADNQLLAAGWKKGHWPDWVHNNNDCITYEEPGGQKRHVSIEPNVSIPVYELTTDLLTGGVPQKGWVGITVTRSEDRLNWLSRSLGWLSKVFAGTP